MSDGGPRPALGRFVLTVLLAATGWLLLALLTPSASADAPASDRPSTTAPANAHGWADDTGSAPAWAARPHVAISADSTEAGDLGGDLDAPATSSGTAEQPPPPPPPPPPPEPTPAPTSPEPVAPSSPPEVVVEPEPYEPAPTPSPAPDPVPAPVPAPAPAPAPAPDPDPVSTPAPAPATDQPDESAPDPLLPLPIPVAPAGVAATAALPSAEPVPVAPEADVVVPPVGELGDALQTAALDPTTAAVADQDVAVTSIPGTEAVGLESVPAGPDAATAGRAERTDPASPTQVSVCRNATGGGRTAPPLVTTSSPRPAPTGGPVVAAVAPTTPVPDLTPSPPPSPPSPPPPLPPPTAPTTGAGASSGSASGGGAQNDDPDLTHAVTVASPSAAVCAASVRQMELASELATDDAYAPGSRPD